MTRLARWSGMLIGGCALAGAGFVVGAAVWRAATARDVEELARVARVSGTPATGDELPAPVSRYFDFSLPRGRQRITAARVDWVGEFQMRPAAGWVPFTAVQYFVSGPPGFVWDAKIRMMPLVEVYVRDVYRNGRGTMLGRIGGLVPVVDEGGTPEIAQSALARWLGEAVWLPTALRSGAGVAWEAVDDSTAIASVTDGRVSASATFHFGSNGEIRRMTALRYRDVEGKAVLTRFEGRYWDYARRNGVMVPLHAEVAWLLPEGRFPYWRGSPAEIQYGTGPGLPARRTP
ncbi:MAG TPA: DUF6544 family protein [Longimicrobium sp.]|nr:DUF6544 family protein [Longimicrobium sp.]